MQKKNYAELLKDPRWQKRKTEILVRDNFTCQRCGCTTKQLHVHHKFYDGRNPWDYEDDALITLCEDCHNKEHGKTIPKKGCVYINNHGDYSNYMVCYGMNNFNKKIYLFGFDDGAGEYSIYIEQVDWDFFKENYIMSEDFWNGLYNNSTEISYIPSVLLNMMVSIYIIGNGGKDCYSYYVEGFQYSDKKVIEYLSKRIYDLAETNDYLFSAFRDIIC